MFPYKIQMQQSLDDVDKDKQTAFCCSLHQYVEDNPTIIHHILFTNEAYFHLKVYISNQNMCVWDTENLYTVMQTLLHPKKCTVWCTISYAGIVRQIFLDDAVDAECQISNKIGQDHIW
jgi:hypothetical protein